VPSLPEWNHAAMLRWPLRDAHCQKRTRATCLPGGTDNPCFTGTSLASPHQSERRDQNPSAQVDVGVGPKLLQCNESP
jgi:hypothetical protein